MENCLNNYSLDLILVACNDDEMDDQEYENMINSEVNKLQKWIADCHGPNALKLFGNRLVSCTPQINRSKNGCTEIRVSCKIPSSSTIEDFAESISYFWERNILGTSEAYLI